MADVVSFSFGEVLFAVFLDLDLGQGSRIALASFGITQRDVQKGEMVTDVLIPARVLHS